MAGGMVDADGIDEDIPGYDLVGGIGGGWLEVGIKERFSGL